MGGAATDPAIASPAPTSTTPLPSARPSSRSGSLACWRRSPCSLSAPADGPAQGRAAGQKAHPPGAHVDEVDGSGGVKADHLAVLADEWRLDGGGARQGA